MLIFFHLFFLCVCIALDLSGEIPKASLQVFPPMVDIYHPVSTTSKEAQKSFDLGLTYLFAFNHDLAFYYFQNASKVDPRLAMAYWGMAMALGQNVNDDITPERQIKCYDYIQKAKELSQNASENEKEYINAASERYTNDLKANFVPLRFKYREAMKRVVQANTEDLDAAVLYSESILNLDPWNWWSQEGEPNPGIMEAIGVLQSVLSRNPLHIGANHFYIHAWEESPTPERALLEAYRLGSLFPESGHLVHMPCHIFIPVGDYEQAAANSKLAIAQDRAYYKKYGLSLGMYPVHYLSHNLAIFVRVCRLQENYENAIQAAHELVAFVTPFFDHMPDRINLSKSPLEVYLYFHKWNEILNYRFTAQTPVMQAFWHYSRSKAFAALGKSEEAKNEFELMQQFQKKITNEELSNNSASQFMAIAEKDLQATFAFLWGDSEEGIKTLREAINIQDGLNYDEPPAWYYSLRMPLGAELIKQGDFVGAEKLFREELQHLRRNGRALYGLYLSLRGQKKEMDAYWVEREMNEALKYSSQKLSIDSF